MTKSGQPRQEPAAIKVTPPKDCAWCGRTVKLTKEHVWPQWLRQEIPAAQRLIEEGKPAERRPHYEPIITVAADGTLQHEWEKHKDLNVLLPMVTVPICGDCNNVRLNALEKEAQRLLIPFLRGEQGLAVDKRDCGVLAAWALKTIMNYALTRGSQTNPFSSTEYHDFHSSLRPPANVRVWILTAASRFAQVGLQIVSWSIRTDYDDPPTVPDNCAQAILSLGGIVFVMTKTPAPQARLLATLEPPPSRSGKRPSELTALRRRRISLAIGEFDERYMDDLDVWMRLPNQFSLPIPQGATIADLREIDDLWAAGVPRSALLPRLTPPPKPQPLGDQSAVQAALDKAAEWTALDDPLGVSLFLTRAARDRFYSNDFSGSATLGSAAVAVPGSPLSSDPEALYRVGQSYWNLHNPQCIEWYERAIQAGLTKNAPRYGRVDGLVWSGRYAEALHELMAIPKRTTHDRGTIIAAGVALQYLVEELGLDQQNRRDLTPAEEQNAQLQPMDLIRSIDATSQSAWGRTSPDNPRHDFQMARAWFGNQPISWLGGALAVAEHEPSEINAYLEIGVERCIELTLIDDKILDVLKPAGKPADKVRKALTKAKSLHAPEARGGTTNRILRNARRP